MRSVEMRELLAFAGVARHLNFTRAAAELGISPPTLSQCIKALEDKLGVRLLTRTTRSVALTEAGAHLLARSEDIFRNFEGALDELTRFGKAPSGDLRLLVSRTAATVMVGPLMGAFFDVYPDIHIEMIVDDLHLDLVANRIDAGIQVGERIEKDMIAIRLVAPFEQVLMASPRYLEGSPAPASPPELRRHTCIRLRSPWDGTVQPWKLQNGAEQVEVAVDGPCIVNDLRVLATVVAGGAGIGLLPPALVESLLSNGMLVRILEGWCNPVSGLYLYHPSRRQVPAALSAFINFMRDRKTSPDEKRAPMGRTGQSANSAALRASRQKKQKSILSRRNETVS
jgi:DNA-binding transcriptional LysR family regulator